MTRVSSIKDIGLVYEAMKQIQAKPSVEVVEEKAVKKLNTYPKAEDKKINVKKIVAKGSDKNAFVHKDSGPESAEGFKKDIVDPKTAKKNNNYEPQKYSTALEKNEQKNINNNMSKSIFDKLYEDVMKDDAIDLGVEAGPEGEAGDKASNVDVGSEDVTLTLSRDVAQKLHDLLSDVLGGGVEDESGSEGDVEEDEQAPAAEEDEQHKAKHDKKDEDKKDEDEEVAGEATDIEELPDSKGQALTGKNNKVAGKLGHVKSSKASGDATGGSDGKPVALPDSKGHSLTGKNNKVNAPGYKPGDLFK